MPTIEQVMNKLEEMYDNALDKGSLDDTKNKDLCFEVAGKIADSITYVKIAVEKLEEEQECIQE